MECMDRQSCIDSLESRPTCPRAKMKPKTNMLDYFLTSHGAHSEGRLKIDQQDRSSTLVPESAAVCSCPDQAMDEAANPFVSSSMPLSARLGCNDG
jgi:hypothetical protein